ncbi:LysR family transcriptional regulator substrate-binding protein [Streptomyces sp. NPDC048106]|uniref:LysR family transcriptional regulator substrate-binding protein n=1 Tax=Streptomyces sp. NPDC048106 TaxID=3155750 RepID=UPI0034546201
MTHAPDAVASVSGGGRAPAVRLGIHETPGIAHGVIARAGLHPRDFELVPYDIRDPFRPLRTGQVDVMIVKYGLREDDITVGLPVDFDERAVLMDAEHPLAGRASLSIEDVAAYPVFERPEGFPSYVWDLIVPPRSPAGAPIRRVHPLTTVPALVHTLTTTQAVHVSFRSVEAALPPRIRAVPLHDVPSAPISLAWPSGRELPGPVRAFLTAAEAGAVPDPAVRRPRRTTPPC